MDYHHQIFHLTLINISSYCIVTYYKNPQNTADHKHKVPAAIEFWQCFLKEKKKCYEFSAVEVKPQYEQPNRNTVI